MAHCCATTKQGVPCPINADRQRDGVWYCHVHDPSGVFRENMLTFRRDKVTAAVDRCAKKKRESDAAWRRAMKRMAGAKSPKP